MGNGKFYVVGGEYADTSFTEIAGGKAEERYGPYLQKEAHDAWRALAAKTVDNALIRYRIRPEEEVAGAVWYVVGGEYATTDFTHIAEESRLESYGPFVRREALAVWRALTSKTVDNAMVRYDILDADELAALRANPL
jgi:hypothetical protein